MEKKHLEAKGVRVNIRKTKILIWSENLHSFKDLGKHLCEVCRKGIVSNSIFCDECRSWIHKKCSSFKSKSKGDPNYRRKKCVGLCRLVDGRPEKHVI